MLQVKTHLVEWTIATGGQPDEAKIMVLMSLIEKAIQDYRVPHEVVPRIFELCYVNYSRVSVPNFIKAWHDIKDSYWAEKNRQTHKDESKDEVCAIPGMSWDRYLYYSECVRIRLQIPEMIQSYHPMRSRQLELMKIAGIPDVPSEKEDMVLRYWLNDLPQGLKESIWRRWQSIVAPLRSRRFNDD